MTDFSVTVLVTREEYAAFAAAAAKKSGFSVSFALGVACLVAGGALFLFEQMAAAWFGLVAVGVVLCLWDGVIAPKIAAAVAAREYEALFGGRMAQTLVFSAGSVRVSTPHAEGSVPLSAVTRVVSGKVGVQLDFGRELSLFIPVRSVTREQLTLLCALGK